MKVGFDFGTTNSLVSIIADGRPISFLDDEDMPIPSVVCYEGSRIIVGKEAKSRLGEAGLGIKGNTVRSPKALLGQESVFVEGVERSPVDIVHDVVNYVARQAVEGRRTGLRGGIHNAVVTIPLNMVGYRRAAFRDAFRKAGIGIFQFIHEPLAALYGYFRSGDDFDAMVRRYDRKFALVVDWGGGTLDLTVCRIEDGLIYQIVNDGTDDTGGDRFDEAIQNFVLERYTSTNREAAAAETNIDAKTRLLHRCERAKIDLSGRSRVALYVPDFFKAIEDDAIDWNLTRDDLENATEHLVYGGIRRIHSLLEAAGLAAPQIALCLAVGGMANMPAISTRLHEIFGAQRVKVSSRSASLISEGAAWIAHDDRRLSLAKNIELELARNSHMPLLRAGTEMPTEAQTKHDQFHLYCVDPRDGFAKMQIQAPIRPGVKVLPNDPRQVLTNLILEVDSVAQPFKERLELDISIDDNLVLRLLGRSLNRKHLVEEEVHNLEFALKLPKGDTDPNFDDHKKTVVEMPNNTRSQGRVAFRANVADEKNESLVPGELLYSYKPLYFDKRRDPPKFQEAERLYYEPCALCGRASNDPLCRCGSSL